MAVFPPPTVFFPAREVDTNLGYVWYRKDGDTAYAVGVKQADHEDDTRYLQNYALYNAPPGTLQRMATYFMVTADDAATTRTAVLALTHGDTYKPIAGYKTLVNHFHLQYVDRLREGGSLDTGLPDLGGDESARDQHRGPERFSRGQAAAQRTPGRCALRTSTIISRRRGGRRTRISSSRRGRSRIRTSVVT